MEENDTIAALSTGKGNAALAIIRISGKKTFENLTKWLRPEKRFLRSALQEIHLYQFYNKKTRKTVDEITAIKYASPKSFTGEDMVEIICHGGEIVVEEILACLLSEGISLAKKGEFTKRAFINGKMDLLKAEAIGQIIQSKSRKQYSRAIKAYQGCGERKIIEWKEIIKSIIVDCEAHIEFPEEDDLLSKKREYIRKINDLYSAIKKEIKNREKINRIENGLSIPIVGIANAGKSTLFNKIIGFERALVHHEEGTTRDAISEEIIIGGERIRIIDTAGLSRTKNQIEKMGIQKTWENIDNGTMIIWVTPSNKEINEYEKRMIQKTKKEKILGIISKKDLNAGENKGKILKKMKIPYKIVSLIGDNETEKILQFIIEHVEKLLNENEIEHGIICTKRQEEILIRMMNKIKSITGKNEILGEEIISHELKFILNDMTELVGETTNEDIINEIFNQFCIGK
jgi:tRNA modification GTPase TrmE